MHLKRETRWAIAFATLTAALRLPFLWLPFDATDEGYYATVAQTTRGARLYADLWYVRPPFLNGVYSWALWLSSAGVARFDFALRVLALLFAAATVGVFARFLFARLTLRSALLGSVLAALMTASLALQNETNAETWMMLPYVAGGLLVLAVALQEREHAEGSREFWLLAAAGALAGAAGAFKQVALVDLALPIVAWLAFDHGGWRRWLALFGAYLAGVLSLWVVVALWVAATDDLRAFLYFAWYRNFVYAGLSHARIDTTRVMFESLGKLAAAFTAPAAAGLAVLSGAALRRRTGEREWRIALFAAGWLALSAIGVAASGRFYQHYFIQATIPLALLIAAATDAVLVAENRRWVARAVLAAVVAAALLPPLASWIADVRGLDATAAQRRVFEDLGVRLPRYAPPGGTVLVWGIGGAVRAYCPLKPATRLVLVDYNYGWSPLSRGSLLGERFPSTSDVVMADLDRATPDVIVLTAPLQPPTATTFREGPDDGTLFVSRLFSLVARHYKVAEQGPGYVVMQRVP